MATFDNSKNNIILFCFILVCSVLMGLMQFLTPYSFDDLSYLLQYHDYKENISDDLDLNQLYNSAIFHYNFTNGRFGDILVPLFLLLPKWMFAIITSISFLIIFATSIKLLSKTPNIVQSILLISILSVILPYHEYLFTVAFSVNYIVGAAIILPILYLFLFPKRHSTIILFFICLLSIIAGAWHECFSIPLGIAMCVYLVVYRKNLQTVQTLIFIFALLGACFIACSPGFWYRINDPIGIIINPIYFWGYIAIPFFFICINIFNLWKAKDKHDTDNCSSKFSLFTIIVICTNLIIYFASQYFCYRIFFISLVLGSITSVSILSKFLFTQKLYSKTITIAASIIIITHLLASIYYQKKYDDEHSLISELFKKSDDGVVYYDIFGKYYAPLITLEKPLDHEFLAYNWWPISSFSKYYGGDTDKVLKIVPSALQNATPKNSQCLSEEFEFFAKDGVLFTTRNHEKATVNMTFQTQDKNTYTVSFYLVKYNSDKLTYLYPHCNWTYAGEKIVDYGIW